MRYKIVSDLGVEMVLIVRTTSMALLMHANLPLTKCAPETTRVATAITQELAAVLQVRLPADIPNITSNTSKVFMQLVQI